MKILISNELWRVGQIEALLVFTQGKAHGLRNEITALQESASLAGLFTPLIWWQ
jgi:hypothetical protein